MAEEKGESKKNCEKEGEKNGKVKKKGQVFFCEMDVRMMMMMLSSSQSYQASLLLTPALQPFLFFSVFSLLCVLSDLFRIFSSHYWASGVKRIKRL